MHANYRWNRFICCLMSVMTLGKKKNGHIYRTDLLSVKLMEKMQRYVDTGSTYMYKRRTRSNFVSYGFVRLYSDFVQTSN